ncbi:MAG: hypothetical protein V4628_00210 [Pseudomonadota bacterium]
MQLSTFIFTRASLIAVATFCSLARANDPEPIQLGFLEVRPTLDTNVTPLGSTWLPNGEEENAELLVFKPRLAAFASDGKNQFSSSLEILNGNYSTRQADNFVDFRVENTARVPLDERNVVKLRSELFNTHETLNSSFRKGDAPVPNRFTTSTVNGSYEYATSKGKGRMVLDSGTFAKTYTNNPALDFRSHEDFNWGSTFYVRVLPGTDMVMRYRFKDVNYLDGRANLAANIEERDNTETNAYLGATWEAPARVPGKLKIASGFNDTAIEAFRAESSSARWETNVRWEPLEDSIVLLNADRIKREGSGLDTLMNTTSLRGSWEYLWTGRLKSAIAGNYSDDTYLDTNRTVEGLGLKLRMDYAYSNWLNMFVAVGRDEKRSAFNDFNFTQRTFMLGVTATLEHLWGW